MEKQRSRNSLAGPCCCIVRASLTLHLETLVPILKSHHSAEKRRRQKSQRGNWCNHNYKPIKCQEHSKGMKVLMKVRNS